MVLGPWVVCLFPGMTRSMLCAARFPFVHKIIHPKEEKYRTELRLQHAYMRGWELLVTLQKKLMTKKKLPWSFGQPNSGRSPPES